MADGFTPDNVNLTDASDDLIRDITCYLNDDGNQYDGSLGMDAGRPSEKSSCD